MENGNTFYLDEQRPSSGRFAENISPNPTDRQDFAIQNPFEAEEGSHQDSYVTPHFTQGLPSRASTTLVNTPNPWTDPEGTPAEHTSSGTLPSTKSVLQSIYHRPSGLQNGTTRGTTFIEKWRSNHKLHNAMMATTDWIHEWTPFLLVSSYFATSICLYMIFTERLFAIFWFIYLLTNFYIAGATVIEAFMSLRPCRDAREAVRKAEERNWVFPTPDGQLLILDIVIVAYLPNEKDIITGRIKYALERIAYPGDKLRINIVYNTPTPIEPLETEMRQMAAKDSRLRIIKVPGSTSKAHNLNYFFSLDTGSDVIAIYDCDHYAHPFGPRWAIERFMSDPETDIVQGRCVVYNAHETLLTAMICAEFDKIYAVSHPGRAAMWGFGLFTGSNGYWRTPLIRKLKMDSNMLTEDIDSALRAFSAGAKCVHDLNVVSYELGVITVKAFWKQRLRWAQGWAQASARHVVMSWRKPNQGNRTLTARFGLLSLLLIREWSYYLVTQYFCLVVGIVILDFPTAGSTLARLVFYQYPVSEWFFIIR